MAMVVQIGADVQAAVKGVKDVSLTLKDQQQILKNLKAEYASLSTSQARSAIGKGLAEDIKIANDEIKRLGGNSASTFSNLGRGVGEVLTPLRQLAFILPGIGIAGIFNLAFEGIEKAITALKGTASGLNDVRDSIAGAKDEFVKATKIVNELRDEINLAKEGFLNKDAVVKHYNETIGKTTGLVNNLSEAETALNKNADAYIRFTLLKAAANVALGKAADVAFEAAVQNQKDIERISKITPDKEGIGEFIKSGEENLRKAEQESFAKRVNNLKDISNNFLKEAAEISKSFGFNFFDANKIEKPVKEAVKKIKEEVQRQFIFRDFAIPIKILPIFTVPGTTFLERFEANAKQLIKIIKGEGDIVINIPVKAQAVLDAKQASADLIRPLNQELSLIATNAAGDFAAAFGEGLGKAISGGGLKSIFSSLFSSISQAMKAFGEALIKFGIGALAIKNLITNPALAIAAGIALIAASTIIASSIPKFGEGGIVNGATLGIVGERGPEVIAPLDQLRGMIGGIGSNVSVNVSGVIKGNDLALIAARTQRSQNRTT